MKLITAKEAARLIPDHATIGVAGMGLSGWAEESAVAIAEAIKQTGHPCDLTLRQGSAISRDSQRYRKVQKPKDRGPDR